MSDRPARPRITPGSVWFVTGCSTGFGHELAKQLLAQGSSVAVTARQPDELSVFNGQSKALVLKLDVTDQAEVAAAVAAAEARFGHIDVLVNNAGIGYFAAIEEGEDTEVRRMFDVNVFGMGAVIQAVLPGMRKRRQGFIINVSSIGGLRSFPAIGWYNATKFGHAARHLHWTDIGHRHPHIFRFAAPISPGQMRVSEQAGGRIAEHLRRHRAIAIAAQAARPVSELTLSAVAGIPIERNDDPVTNPKL